MPDELIDGAAASEQQFHEDQLGLPAVGGREHLAGVADRHGAAVAVAGPCRRLLLSLLLFSNVLVLTKVLFQCYHTLLLTFMLQLFFTYVLYVLLLSTII